MTKVDMQFRTERPLDDALLSRLSSASSIYGIFKIQVAPSRDRLSVEYDATRLKPADVHAALAARGVPLSPQ